MQVVRSVSPTARRINRLAAGNEEARQILETLAKRPDGPRTLRCMAWLKYTEAGIRSLYEYCSKDLSAFVGKVFESVGYEVTPR